MAFQWRRSALWTDVVRVACAAALCFISALTFPWFSLAQIILGSLGLVFGWYLLACMVKLVSEITVDEKGVCLTRKWLSPLRVNWDTAQRVEIRHFSLGQFRKAGLMDVKLKNIQTTILIDDGVERFPELLQLMWKYAKQSGIELSETSKVNLLAAGCSVPTDQ